MRELNNASSKRRLMIQRFITKGLFFFFSKHGDNRQTQQREQDVVLLSVLKAIFFSGLNSRFLLKIK